MEPCEVALGCGLGRRAFGAFWVTWGSLGRQSGGLCARATRKTFAGDRLVPLPSLLTRKKSARSTEDGPPSTSVLGCGGAGRRHALSLYRAIYIPSPTPLLSISSLYYHPLSWTPPSLHIHTSCPSPPYTITHSAGHPPCLPSLTILLSYFPTLTVHLLPILSPTQLDTPFPRNVNCDSFDSNSDNAASRARALAFSTTSQPGSQVRLTYAAVTAVPALRLVR